MSFIEAGELKERIQRQFPRLLQVSFWREGHGIVWLKVRKRGPAPQDPKGSIFAGDPFWVTNAEEWPALAAEHLGLEVADG